MGTSKKFLCLAAGVVFSLMFPQPGFAQSSKLAEQLNLQPAPQITDNSGLWTNADQVASKQIFDAVKKDVKLDFRVIIVRSLQSEDLFSFTTSAFEKLKIGDSTANRGALIVVAVAEKKIRFQVSKAIEPVFTDAFVGYIERNQMVPYFDRNELNPGIHATIELAIKRAYDSLKLNVEQIKQDDLILQSRYRTGGGGASSQFGKGSSPQPSSPNTELTEYGAQPTPELAWQKFYQLHERKVMNPKVDIFDDQAKEMAKRYTIASLDFIARLYANKKPTIRAEGNRAAIVFLDDPNFELAPWFFKKSNKGWQLDGSAYPSLIKYNHLNQWHFAQIDHPYTFAFRDYSINLNGYATSPSGLIKKAQQSGNNQQVKRRAWMGASFLNAQKNSRYLSKQVDKGVIIYEIVSGGAAAKAGIEEGDVALTIDGVDIVGYTHMAQLLASKYEGDIITLEVLRGNCIDDFPDPSNPNHKVRPITKGKARPTRMNINVTLLGSRDGK
ncbi:MAG: TPM domain-containing protein [Bdellovibrionales bacterium]